MPQVVKNDFESEMGTSEDSRIISAIENLEDGFQNKLRPKNLSEYIGQEKLKEHIALAVKATKRRGEPLDHVLLHGPPGLGKTTLASVIAAELGVSFKSTSGPVLEKPGDLAAILSGLSENDVLFIDEIHRLPRVVEEILYPVMEDFQLDIIIGQGPVARSVKIEVKPFTLIAATTRTASLTAPLRDRFGIVERFDFYTNLELAKIVSRSAGILNVDIQDVGAKEIANRSRGTPRIANRLLKRARDYAQELADSIISEDVAKKALKLLDIDERGLDRMDRLILSTIIQNFSGGPVGVDSLSASIQEERSTIEDVYEPFLLNQGFLRRTARGREVTEMAYLHLGLKYRGNSQTELFNVDED